jgi:serine/threonine-protein kinase
VSILVGDVVAGKYRVDGVAGEGGIGIVYEAEHVILRQRVALKVLLAGALGSTGALDRFSLEASAIARIACEHVVRVMDAGTMPNGAPYLVMEYLEGTDLEKMLAARGPLPPAEVVDFALQALEGLVHAHAANVVHRDLKPANLFLARLADGRQVIKLLDFGLAIPLALDAVDSEPGRILGSPQYMSPEQLRKDTLDARTDLWSLGVVIHELVAGRPPFDGSISDLVSAILNEPAPPLREATPALADVVARCLAKDSKDRWPDAAALARALETHGTGSWASAVARIERVLANAAPAPEPRRFETLDAALSALDQRPRGIVSPTTLGATIPAPPSTDVTVTMPEAAPKKLRILMIDDSEFVLGVHEEVLEEAGFDVRATRSVAEFRELLEAWTPDLVLMDVQMPDASGDELCRQVKERTKARVPVVLVSHLDTAQLAERAAQAGADAYLSKTGDWPAFVEFVRNICALAYSPEHLP